MSILTHSPAIVRDGLILCLDAGAEQSWPANTKGSASNWGAEVLADGGFETWSSSTALTHWSQYIAGSSTVNRDDAEEESGTYCLRLDVDGSDSNTLVYSSVACFVPGRRYRVTFSAKCSSGTLNASVYESTAATVPDNGIPDTELPLTTSYQSFVIDFTAHGNSGANQNLLFGRRSGGGGASKSIYFDNASVRELHWHDLSGNFNDGALTNAPIFSAESGAGGTKSFDFDGSSDYMQLDKSGTGDYTGALTVSAWFKADSSATGRLVAKDQASGANPRWLFYKSGADLHFYFNDNANTEPYLTTTLTYGDWYHVAVTITSGSQKLYLNGAEVGSDTETTSNFTTDTNLWIGRYASASYWDGKIAIVHLYSRALTAAEIQQNYRTHKGRFGL